MSQVSATAKIVAVPDEERGSPTRETARVTALLAPGANRWSNGLFVLPFVAVYLALLVAPLLFGWWLSLRDVDLLADSSEFAGLTNYVELFHDPIFRGAVRNTFFFVVMTTPAFLVLGLLLALALNRPGRLAAALRATFFGASVLSVTVVTLVWRLVTIPDRGLVANICRALHVHQIYPFATEGLALPTVALVTVWWIIGFPMMLFLAGLQQIPQDIYEAAALDNAGRWRTLFSITLPSLKRTMALVAVIEIVLQFQLFGQAFLLTQGGPNNSSRPIVQFIYQTGFQQWRLGLASAAAQVLFALMLLGVSLQVWIARRREPQ
jgi:multiple sugar transport system permease protein